MPYATLAQLPPATAQLPEAAKTIWQAAFNAAWDTYADAEDREQRAHATAWAAVKERYIKRNGRWKLRDKTKPAPVAEVGTGGAPMATMTKKENNVDYPADDFAYVPDPMAPGSWKCRMTEKPGEATRAQLGAACGAMGTIPEKDLPAVKRTMRGAYAKLGVEKKDMPESIMESADVGGPGGVPGGFQMMVLAEDPTPGESLAEQPDVPPPDVEDTEGIVEAYEQECLEVEGGEVEADLAEAEITAPPKPLIATLIKAGLNKSGKRLYTETFLRQCIGEGRFTGSYCHVDHPTQEQQRQRPERSMRTIAARTGDAFWDESAKAVKAPIVWLNADRPGTPGYEAEGLFRDPIVRQRSGLSIFYMGPVDVEEAVRPETQGRKVQVPKALGDSRKFDVDLVTAPGAGGGLPLHESDVPEEEPTMETTDELKAQYPELVAQLREEWEAETPPAEVVPVETAPVAEAEAPAPETETQPEPEVVAEVEAPKAVDPAIAELREEVARLKSGRMLDEFLAREPVDQSIREAARAALADDVFADEAAFRAKARVVVDGIKEAVSKAAGPRVADLGGTSPAEGEHKFTLGDLTQKKEAK